jgi:NADH dehydrogenase FAD-containing subunit
LLEKLAKTNIKIITSAKIQRIAEKEVEYSDKQDRLQKMPVDTVVLAAGFVPKLELARTLKVLPGNLLYR